MIVDVQDRQLHRPGGHGRRGGRVGAGLSSSSSLPPQAATSAIIPSIVARAQCRFQSCFQSILFPAWLVLERRMIVAADDADEPGVKKNNGRPVDRP